MNRSRARGPAVEIFVYQYTERVGRTWRRTLVRNVTLTRDRALVMQGLPMGRYRIEWRDAQRWVVHVETWSVGALGEVLRNAPVARQRPPRRVPPPVWLG